MRYSLVFVTAIAASVEGHGLITQIQGANGVTMAGLSAKDGTPRDCALPTCGAEADTSIIRKNELGTNKASALGRTPGGTPVDAASAIMTFLGPKGATGTSSSASSASSAASSAADSDAASAAPSASASAAATKAGAKAGKAGAKNAGRGLLSGLLGGGDSGSGTKTPKGTVEQGVAKGAGTGAASGLPTCADDGTITMTYHQVNQDGAGPLAAAIDPTSGGTDPTAFKDAQVTMNVPGAVAGLSLATTTDYPVKVQMPAGMTCSGSVGGAQNVCIVRMQNSALAGPFGGSAAFTQSKAARKRAIEYNLRKRHFARGILGKPDLEE